MASISESLADLPLEQLSLYHAVDPFLASILVFHGPVATANATVSSSRIQIHIFTPAGFQSYPRITVSPAAPIYAAVNHLPREKQGDEVCRGLAVGILKYFSDIPEPVRNSLMMIAKSEKQGARVPKLFDETHAADLANKMQRVESSTDVVHALKDAYKERKIPWIDLDVILPAGTIQPPKNLDDPEADAERRESSFDQYGKYSNVVQLLGEPVFLPTSKLRRAPSQPTNLSKSKLFSKSQKEALRLSMCEVVDTEERYVAKMYDLVNNVVEEFREKARNRSASSDSPDEDSLAQLFPSCINDILETNMGFLDSIRQILDDTEKEAIEDIAGDTDLGSSAHRGAGRKKDPIGALAFAHSLQEWFPKFSQPYADYMRAHNGFSQILNNFLKDNNSSFSKRVYETGEQKLRSLLMEPVQRLPRYSLLIDAMTSSLPSMHPAVRPLLKARDIIKEICSLDSPVQDDHSKNLKRLQGYVPDWPSSVLPTGRLITMVDFYEIAPPYRIDSSATRSGAGIMLLYQDCLIMLTKLPESNITARSLSTELDMPPSSSDVSLPAPELSFSRSMDIGHIRCSQSYCGRMMYLTPADNLLRNQRPRRRETLHALELKGSYEGKAHRLIEDVIKARIEGRFSEKERESGKWVLLSPGSTYGNLGILASVFEEDENGSRAMSRPSNIRVLFDKSKAICQKAMEDPNIEAVVSISQHNSGRYKLEVDSVVGTTSTDTVEASEFMNVLSKRINHLLRPLNQPQNTVLSESIIHSNFDILRCVASHLLGQARVPRGFRPPSPTKLLSSFWGGQSKEPTTPSKSISKFPVMGEIPKIPRPGPSPSNAQLPPPTSVQDENPKKITVVGSNPSEQPEDSLQLLEKTFTAYILALRSRSGNIVGRTLRGRDNADRVVVNDLYNTLLEDAGKIQAAAEVPVDVLFVAFETFMGRAWRDQIGPVIPPTSLRAIQNKFDTMFPGDFEDFFRRTLGDMSPQNRRALTALMRLLAELLDASGNDGDRGALTAAFAELLTEEGNPLQYVSLLDRLVEDFERLFDDTTPFGAPLEGVLVNDPNTFPSRTRSMNTGSVTSNTSSFRKRFGFGHSRENSRTEGESKVSSIIRTLSKSKGSNDPDSQPSSLSKGSSLLRSKSTDTDSRFANLLRPSSRDRPAIHGSSCSEEQLHRPNSAHNNTSTLSSIGEGRLVDEPLPPPRKKRRSSLSDLKSLPIPGATPPLPPLQSRVPDTTVPSAHQRTRSDIPSPSRPVGSMRPSPTAGSPKRLGSPIRSVPTNRKENVPPTPLPSVAEKSTNRKAEQTSNPEQTPRRRTDRHSNIPLPSPGLRERSNVANGPESTPRGSHPNSTAFQKTQRLKMQSPQKLRERLQNEKKAQAQAESSLQAELASIGNEISGTKSKKGSPTATRSSITSPPNSSALLSRVRTLETRLSTLTSDLGKRTTTLEKDVESSLLVSERRVKKLDELYREASAENEALYERFNSELGRITKEVRTGKGEAALKAQLKEALEDVGRVKKENMRLKREVTGLRAQQFSTVNTTGDGSSGES
ncbi:hypothetical protein FQN54_006266 [Arachnomyces sp. PD_36]|nr:hypothetical protein FQN54_006266 [Arachnomyces sp. PD_36]